MIFDLQNFVTSRPIPSQDPKVLSLHDPISSRCKKNYPSFFLSSTVIIMAITICFDYFCTVCFLLNFLFDALKLAISRSLYTSSPSILVHEVMLTPATKDGKTQGAPTTAPKKCCYTVNLRLLLPATVTQCLTGFASRGHRPDPSMELKTIFTIRRTFKAFEDPRQA